MKPQLQPDHQEQLEEDAVSPLIQTDDADLSAEDVGSISIKVPKVPQKFFH